MNKVILFCSFILLSFFCYANDGGYEIVGDSFHPINIVDVSIDYERLIFLQHGNQWEIEVYIELNNQTNETLKLLLGFEFSYFDGPGHDVSYEVFNSYILLVNGEAQQFQFDASGEYETICKLLYTPTLQPGINRIYHNYTIREGYGSMAGTISYILKTGARWKDGLIKEIEVFIKPDRPGMLRIHENSFSDFDVIGEGKVFDGYFSTDDYFDRYENVYKNHYDKTYSIKNGYLYKSMKKYAPGENIGFDFFDFAYRGYSARPALPEDLIQYTYTTGMPSTLFLPYKYIYFWEYAYKDRDYEYNGEEIYKRFENNFVTLSAEYKRMLRNTIYAMHGYVFNDPELQEYFETQYWYFPNKNRTSEEIELSGEMRDILDFMVQTEKN